MNTHKQTERKREAEEAARMVTVVRDSNDAITIQDFAGRITAWNHGAELMYGYGEAEALEMNIERLTALGKVDEQKDFVRRLVAGEAVTSLETQRVTKDGRILDVWMTVTKLVDKAGKPIGIASTERDITHRKREAEEAARLVTVVRDSNDAITIQDFEGQITAWNHGAERMYGYSEVEALEMNIERLTAPGKVDEQKDFVRRLVAGEAVTSLETQRVTKDGRILDVWMTVTKLVDKAGKPIGIASTERDITERNREANALRESESKFKRLYDSNIIGVIFWDTAGNIVQANGEFLRIVGYTDDDVLSGRASWKDMTPPEYAYLDEKAIKEMTETGISAPFEKEYVRKDGSHVPIRLNAALLEGGRDVGICFIQDITERKRAEDALRISKERLLFATEGAKLGVWNWNTVTGELVWSDRCKALFGIPLDETMSYPRFRDALHPDDRERTDKAVKDALDNQTDYDIEYRSLWPDGSIHWLAARGRGFYDATGKAVRLEGVVLDIAERKRVEAALKKANEDLERSNKELEQFAYVASHDLQEPLRMVSSYTQLLAQRYEGQLDDKARKYINYAVDGAVRMQRMVNDLLTYSRVGTRGKPLEPTDSHAVLGEAIRNLAATIEENRAIITNDDLPTVRTDASQLVLVFQNLLANAIKFRGEDLPRVHVSTRDSGHEWTFSVKDNGIGIDPQYKDRLFVIFQRLCTREEYPGTGIGLAMCRRIVDRHGGRIWFESEPGKGSTFFFTVLK